MNHRNETPSGIAAENRPTVGRGTVMLMTTLGAIDGTILLMAASGRLSSWSGAATAGLTVISGAGAWLAARQAFGSRRRADAWLLFGMAATTMAATVAAASAGVWLGSTVQLIILPRAVGVVLLLIALEVAGFRLPRAGPVPLPLAATGAAGLLEVGAQWIL